MFPEQGAQPYYLSHLFFYWSYLRNITKKKKRNLILQALKAHANSQLCPWTAFLFFSVGPAQAHHLQEGFHDHST